MLWFVLSFLTALAVASHDAWVKKFFSGLSIYQMLAYPLIYSLPLLILTLPFVPVPPLDAVFLRAFLFCLPINAIGFSLHMRAIQVSPLSLTLPYLSFTPVFMILTGFIVLDEMPNAWGIVGIVIICTGGYILNLEPAKNALLAPLKAVFRETGSWLMLIVAFAYSLGAVFGKQAIMHSSPLFFSITFFAILNILLVAGFRIFGKITLRTFRAQKQKGIIVGLLFFAHVLLHAFAISLTKAAYMIAVKRFSVVLGLIYGGVIFKEKNIAVRTLGTLLMVAGAVLITIWGS
ncbi:MAG: DMT family transporter [Candidatus Latescibacterota bacterium]|nr:MAG: DMT family transporter [Candidatus Latescibacterota bacterium]